MLKPTKRKAFNFLRSYFDVLNEIPEDKDKLAFLLAVINKQFLDEDPEGLDLLVSLSYESQRHAIESSVKGYKDKKKTDLLGNPLADPSQGGVQGGSVGGSEDPCQQEEEEEKEKGEEQDVYREYKHLSICIRDWNKLVNQFGEDKTEEYINRVINYKGNKKYNSLYLTALNWLKKDYPNGIKKKPEMVDPDKFFNR